MPLVYLPRGVDNSSGGQVYVSSNRWAHCKGTWSIFLWSSECDGADDRRRRWKKARCRHAASGRIQIGCSSRSIFANRRTALCDRHEWVGVLCARGRLLPADAIHGNDFPMPTGFHVHSNGIAVTFSESLAKMPGGLEAVLRPENYLIQAWNYRYSSAYGSAEYSTIHRTVRGHDRLPIASVQSLDDQRTLFLEVPSLQPSSQLHLRMAIGESLEPIFLLLASIWISLEPILIRRGWWPRGSRNCRLNWTWRLWRNRNLILGGPRWRMPAR